MKGYIPNELIDEVRNRADIVDIISQYVLLKKKGRYHVGLCPFHNEKSPSFTVTPEKQIFHCFGCNTGGNVFKFIMLKENLNFPEAVRHLGRIVGINIEDHNASPEELKRLHKKKRFFAANRLAMEYFKNCLKMDNALEVRDYLSARGLTKQITEAFEIGFALPGWDTLLKHLLQRGYSRQDLVELGLAVKGKRIYDRFRNRLMFPICNDTGKVVGFGGRVFDDSQPKYLNSPESDYFSKRDLLYGLHLAKDEIYKEGFAVLVEGYLDVITAHQYGFSNVVAPLGTSLTGGQCKLLARYTREVVIVFDSDEAGVEATFRGMDILLKNGLSVRVADVAGDKDPDEFIRKQGAQKWKELIETAPDFVEYRLVKAATGKTVSNPAVKIEIIQKVLPYISVLRSNIEKEEQLKAVANYLNLSWEVIASEFKDFEANKRKKRPFSDKIVRKKHNILLDAREKAEQGLLRMLIENPGLIAQVEENLPKNFFRRQAYQEIYKIIKESTDTYIEPSAIFDRLGEDAQKIFSKIIVKEINWNNPERVFGDLLRTLQGAIKKEKQETILKEINIAENEGNKELVNVLLLELQNC